jgi:Ca2+-binding EF-hand superfamily protein
MDARLIKWPLLVGVMASVASAYATVSVQPESSAENLPVAQGKQEPKHPQGHRGHADRLAHTLMVRDLILQKYDKDGDGALSADEKELLLKDAKAAQIEARRKVIRLFDTDGDGKLSPAERQAMRERMMRRAHTPRTAEHPAPTPEDTELTGGTQPPPPHFVISNSRGQKLKVRPSIFLLSMQLLMERYDKDGDGVLSPDEVAVADKDSHQLYEAKATEILKRYDLDGDGVLSQEEREQAMTLRQSATESDDSTPDDIDLFIQESFDTEVMDCLVEGANEAKQSSQTAESTDSSSES